MTYRYELNKLSSSSFTLQTDHLEHILNALSDNICTTCVEHELCEAFNDISEIDKVYELLSTPCGTEFMFEESNDD